MPALLMIGLAFTLPARTQAQTPSQPLPREVLQALKRADVPPDALAVVVQEVSNGGAPPAPRLSFRAAQPMNPASLFKLLTTAAALDTLGPAYTWSTPVWLLGPVHDGMLDGSLIIKGSGDPGLVLERTWLLLRRVHQLGVNEIRGDIVLDRSAFTAPEGGPADFDGEPAKPYNVQADALMLNYKSVTYNFAPDPAAGVAHVVAEPLLAQVAVDASVPLAAGACGDWRAQLRASFGDAQLPAPAPGASTTAGSPAQARSTPGMPSGAGALSLPAAPSRSPVLSATAGSSPPASPSTQVHFSGSYPAACGERAWPVAAADPRLYNGRLLEALWHEMGGELRGGVHDGTAPAGVAPSFAMTSPPLAEVVREINKFSNNVMAQQLFLTLGLVQRGTGSPDAARQVLRQWLVDHVGATLAADAVIDNGNGLSRDARVSARLLAQLLQGVWSSPTMPELMGSLPVTGIDGTLRHTAAPTGRAHLKTGSLRDVTGVAGYVLARSGRRYVVVGIVNHPNAQAVHPALDALVQWAHDD